MEYTFTQSSIPQNQIFSTGEVSFDYKHEFRKAIDKAYKVSKDNPEKLKQITAAIDRIIKVL